MYTIVIEKNVIKQLAPIPSTNYKKIKTAINSFSENRRPNAYVKLKAGNYHVIYEMENNILTIIILTVAHRKDVYD